MRAAVAALFIVGSAAPIRAEGAFELDVAGSLLDVRSASLAAGVGIGLRYGIARPLGVTLRARLSLSQDTSSFFGMAGAGGYVTVGRAGYVEVVVGKGTFLEGKDEIDIPHDSVEHGIAMSLRVRESMSEHIAFAAQAATLIYRNDYMDTDGSRSFELSVALIGQLAEGW